MKKTHIYKDMPHRFSDHELKHYQQSIFILFNKLNIIKQKNMQPKEQDKQQNVNKSLQKIKQSQFKSIDSSKIYYNRQGSIHYNISYLKSCILQEEQMSKKDLLQLIAKFKNIIKNQPNLVKINGNLMVIGDIHGQFYDFAKIMGIIAAVYGTIEKFCQKESLLFLGDYVDRGLLSVQVMTIIMALKVNYPDKVVCLRGNHQCRTMTAVYNFKAEVLVKYDQQVYERFIELFDFLPLAAIVNKVYFCVHGGISDRLEKIQQIDQINRVRQIPQQGAFCDFMWADPMPKLNQQLFTDTLYNNTRMCSIFFGKQLTQRFQNTNKLKSIIRAHQVFPQGFYRKQWGSKNKTTPSVLTIFSAPNYCGIYGNLGAILHIQDNNFQIRQYREQPINKYNLSLEVLSWSIPQIVMVINQFTKGMITSIGKIYFGDFPQFQESSHKVRLQILLNYYHYLQNKEKGLPVEYKFEKIDLKEWEQKTIQSKMRFETQTKQPKPQLTRSQSWNPPQFLSYLGQPAKKFSDQFKEL